MQWTLNYAYRLHECPLSHPSAPRSTLTKSSYFISSTTQKRTGQDLVRPSPFHVLKQDIDETHPLPPGKVGRVVHIRVKNLPYTWATKAEWVHQEAIDLLQYHTQLNIECVETDEKYMPLTNATGQYHSFVYVKALTEAADWEITRNIAGAFINGTRLSTTIVPPRVLTTEVKQITEQKNDMNVDKVDGHTPHGEHQGNRACSPASWEERQNATTEWHYHGQPAG